MTKAQHTPGPWRIENGHLICADSFNQLANIRGAGLNPRIDEEADANKFGLEIHGKKYIGSETYRDTVAAIAKARGEI